jgi:hypothetical protein
MKKFKKIIKSIIILAVVAGIGILAYYYGTQWYHNKYGENYRWEISPTLVAIQYHNGEVGILNTSTNKIMGRYDKILSSHYYDMEDYDNATFVTWEGSVIIVVKNGLRGYLSDKTGAEIFKPQFTRAWIDGEESHLAACVNKEGKMGFINVKTKKVAIPFQFNFDEDSFIYDDWHQDKSIYDFIFCNGICIVPGEDGKLGIIDTTGRLLLPIEFSDIINWRDANTPHIILKKQIDYDDYDDYDDDCYDDDGYDDDGNGCLYGICDRNFNTIVDFQYSSFIKNTEYSNHGNIFVKNYIVRKDGLWGILDTAFNVILPIKYDYIKAEDNIFIVETDNKYGVLDSKLKTILPMEYDWISYQYISSEKGKFIIAKKDYVQKLYDGTGKIIRNFYLETRRYINVFEPMYERDRLTSYVTFYLDGYYGVIEGMQRVVIPAKYDEIEYLGGGRFACTEDGYVFLWKDGK